MCLLNTYIPIEITGKNNKIILSSIPIDEYTYTINITEIIETASQKISKNLFIRCIFFIVEYV